MGEAGNDTLIGGLGNDYLDGGEGNDTVDYSSSNSSQFVHLGLGETSGGEGNDTIVNIENVIGTRFNDTIYGNNENNFLIGGRGDDTLLGGSGVDKYDGGDAAVITYANTTHYAGSTDHGNNTISFYYSGSAVNVDLGYNNGDGTTGRVLNDGYGNTETYVRNINNIIGTLEFSDILKGNNSKNIINGYGGNDTIYGIGGENTLYGGTGVDVIYAATTKTGTERGDVVFGGQGIDTLIGSFHKDFLIGGEQNGDDVEKDWVDYSSLTNAHSYGIRVDLSSKVTFTFTDAIGDRGSLNGSYSQIFELNNSGTATANFDYISQIEHIIGSSKNDIIKGDNIITTDGGGNTIFAGAGDDTIILDAGGTDYIDGGTGSNWLSLVDNYRGTIDLRNVSGSGGNTNGNVTLVNIQNILGSAVSETVWGRSSTAYKETFVMKGGNDHVLGGAGDDVYDMGIGNDTAYSNHGSDTLIGGIGQDTINHYNNYGSGRGANIILNSIIGSNYNNLATGQSQLTISNQTVVGVKKTVSGLDTVADGEYWFYETTDGQNYKDYMIAQTTSNGLYETTSKNSTFNEVNFNSDFEIFTLGNQADIFSGSNQNDTVYGYGGNDTMWGNGGNDSLYGGDGQDTIFGVSGANVINGDGGADLLFGGIGNDNINGGADNDTIYAKAGNNILNGGINNDVIYVGTGRDAVDGGDGIDTLRFDGGTQRVVVNLGSDTLTYDGGTLDANRFINSWQNAGSNQIGTVSNIENVDGTQYNDTIRGNDSANTIIAGAGDDYIYASLGKDEIHGGDHTANKGDWVDFSLVTTTSGVKIDINTQSNAVFTVGGTTYNQSLIDIENIKGSAQNDIIRGGVGVNTIYGGDGDDQIYGTGGNNSLYGDAGDDTIYSGIGNDYIHGGDDNNTVDYTDRHSSSNVRVNLSDTSKSHNSGTVTATMTGATSGMTDTLVNIQNVNTGGGDDTIWGNNENNIINSGAGNDVIYGIGGNNTIYAGSAADTIYGGTGVDSIFGEDGNDSIVASAGADIIDGGADIDLVDYSSSSTGINLTLLNDGATVSVSHNIGGDFTDSLTNIEGIKGSSTVSNTLTGNNMNNTLIGGNQTDIIKGVSGNNSLSGGAGDDTIFAGTGSDIIDGGAGNDIINVANMSDLTSADIITDTSGIDTLNINGNGTIASSDFNVSGFEYLNLSSGEDVVTFTDKSSFDTFKSKFSSAIDTKGGDDEFKFSSAITEDLDFSKINNLEKLSFSGSDDIVTFGTDEFNAGIKTLDLGNGQNKAYLEADTTSAVQVNGGANNDEFVLDFTRIEQGDYKVNGGAGTDTITLSGYDNKDATNTDIFKEAFTNMEELNLVGTGAFDIDAEVINSWRDTNNSIFKITNSSDNTLNISTNNGNYKWSNDSGSTWQDSDMTNLGTGSYNIRIDGSETTTFTLEVV